jgi:hypothetical protein
MNNDIVFWLCWILVWVATLLDVSGLLDRPRRLSVRNLFVNLVLLILVFAVWGH